MVNNVHILSNSPTRVNSGFGIVTRYLALGLKGLGYNVSVTDMQNVYNIEYWKGIKVYPLNSVEGATGNNFYINELNQFIRNLKDSKCFGDDSAVIFIYPCYDDVGVLNRLYEVHPRTFWYIPIEGENVPVSWVKELCKVKKVVPMTGQGKRELEKGGLNGNLSDFIYHGYDPTVFNKIDIISGTSYCKWSCENWQRVGDRGEMCERGCFKCDGSKSCEWYEKEKVIMNFADEGEELIGDIDKLGKIKDTFGVDCIYGFVGDNNGKRKRIDLLLNSYMSMRGDVKKNSMLLLHTLPVTGNGIDCIEHIKKWEQKHGKGTSGKIAFVYGHDGMGNSWSDKALNIFYNNIDVNVSASGGEGFGLSIIESMAVGKAQIAPKFSSFIELVGDNESGEGRGLLSKLGGYETLSNGIRRGVVSVGDMSNCMERLYNDKGGREKMGDIGSSWVKSWTWDTMVKGFDNILTEVIK